MTWNEESSQRVIERIQHEYSVHLLGCFIIIYYKEMCHFVFVHLSKSIFRLIDNLPAATKKKHKETNNVVVYQGYRLGGIMNDQVYINNYLKLKLSCHKHGELVSFPFFLFFII